MCEHYDFDCKKEILGCEGCGYNKPEKNKEVKENEKRN